MGVYGIDWRVYGEWACGQKSSMTLIYGDESQTATFTKTWKLQVFLQLPMWQ